MAGAIDEHDGPISGFMGYEAKKAIDREVSALLTKAGRTPKAEPWCGIVGPDGVIYRVTLAS